MKVDEPTLTTTSFIYDGNEKEVELNGVETYMTKSNDSVIKATSFGEYSINYTLDSNHEWNTGSDGLLSWYISKAQANITVDTTPIVATYGESVVIPTATSNFGTVTCDKVASDLVNAGTYTITYTVVGNNDYIGDTKTISVTINKAISTIDTTGVLKSYTYNGTEQIVNSGATLNHSETALVYSNNKFTNVGSGTYTITISSIETSNYYGASTTVDITVLSKDLTVSMVGNISPQTYTGSELTPAVTVTDGSVLVLDTDYYVEYSDNINQGAGMVWVIGKGNYKGSAYGIFIILEADSTYTAPTPNTENVYTGSSINLINKGTATGGTMKYAISDSEPIDSSYSETIPSKIDAGTYKVWYKVFGDENHKNSTAQSLSTTIKQKELTAPTLSGTFTYNNSEQSVTINNFDSTTMEYTNDSVSKATNAGTYKVKVNLKDTSNYKWANSFNGELEWKINKADPVYKAPVAAEDLVYDGKFQCSVSEEGTVNDSNSYHWEYKYTLSGTGNDYNIEPVKVSIAGTYTIYYKLVVTNENYTDPNISSSFELVVKKVTPTVTEPTAYSIKYPGQGNHQALCSVAYTNFGTIKYQLENCQEESVPPRAYDIGTYTVYYWVVGDANIYDVEKQSIQCVIYA